MLQRIGWCVLVFGLGVALASTAACTKEELNKDTADKAVDKTKEVAKDVADKTKEVAAATAEVVSDSWITAKVSAKFKDEIGLENSDINVDTKDSVVTLKGTVPSAAAKTKAETIAKGTKGVMKVVNQLQVTK